MTEKTNNKKFVTFYNSIMKSLPTGKFRKLHIGNRRSVQRINRQIWKTIRDHYVENEGGVYISNLGYFCHVILPKRKLVVKKGTNKIMRFKTNGYYYRHFVVDRMDRKQYYHMCTNIKENLKQQCKKRERSGFLYKLFYVDLFENFLLINKDRKIVKPKY